jgi:hypothetical protein
MRPELFARQRDLAPVRDSRVVVIDPFELVRRVFGLLRAGPEGADHSAVADPIEGCQHLREDRRAAKRRIEGTPGEPNVARLRRDGRHQRERVEPAVRVFWLPHEVIGQPDRVVALLVGGARLGQHGIHATFRVEMHPYLQA